MTGYTDTIRRYALDDRFTGELPDADGTGEVGLGTEEVGKRLAVRFMLRLAGERIAAARFQAFGCGFTIAACAAAAERTEGRPLAELTAVDPATIEAVLGGLPEDRRYCAELAAAALQAAAASAAGEGTVRRVDSQPEDGKPSSPGSAADPVYRALLLSGPSPAAPEDRHLFACILAAAAREAHPVDQALGLPAEDLESLLRRFFPQAGRQWFLPRGTAERDAPPEANPEVLEILLEHVPAGEAAAPAAWLARIIATRAVLPGHLWTALGLFERPELTAAIRRHLPALAEANTAGMRWKRFLYLQVCLRHGAVLCKAPTCGDCSDYALCFEEGE